MYFEEGIKMGWGTLDKSFQETIKKFNQLTQELVETRNAITELKQAIVKNGKQNRKLQIIGLTISVIGTIDVILRVIGIFH